MDRIHHIALRVNDIEQAVRWYRQQFDCEVHYLDATLAQLNFENLSLALVIAAQHPPHIGISRDDANRFGPLKTHRDGSASIYIDDPGGNAVEILDATTLKENL
jgi:catechol 2,3-dioxygenase-like lactoylglutathione lyase family enzyme